MQLPCYDTLILIIHTEHLGNLYLSRSPTSYLQKEGRRLGLILTIMKLSTVVASLFFCSAFCAEMSLGNTSEDLYEMDAKGLAEYGKDLTAFEINKIVGEHGKNGLYVEHLSHLLDNNSLLTENTHQELIRLGTGNRLPHFVHALSYKFKGQPSNQSGIEPLLALNWGNEPYDSLVSEIFTFHPPGRLLTLTRSHEVYMGNDKLDDDADKS